MVLLGSLRDKWSGVARPANLSDPSLSTRRVCCCNIASTLHSRLVSSPVFPQVCLVPVLLRCSRIASTDRRFHSRALHSWHSGKGLFDTWVRHSFPFILASTRLSAKSAVPLLSNLHCRYRLRCHLAAFVVCILYQNAPVLSRNIPTNLPLRPTFL